MSTIQASGGTALRGLWADSDHHHKVDLDRGKVEWVITGVGDFETWLFAITERWPQWKVPITFTGGFAGSKNVYLWASTVGGANSGYAQRGTWTVP